MAASLAQPQSCSPPKLKKRSKHVGTAALGCPAEPSSASSNSKQKTVEPSSTGQPRAAVPTRGTYGLATTLGHRFDARQRAYRGPHPPARFLHLPRVEAGQGQRR